MIPMNRFLCGGGAKCYLLSTNNRRSWVPGLASNGTERWPFLVGPTLILLCRLKSEQLKLGTHYLLCTGFVLGTSFNGLRVSVSNAFEDDEFVTSSSGSCHNIIYTSRHYARVKGDEIEGIPRPDVRTSASSVKFAAPVSTCRVFQVFV